MALGGDLYGRHATNVRMATIKVAADLSMTFSDGTTETPIPAVATAAPTIRTHAGDVTGLLDAAIVLSQPAVQHPRAPLVIPWSSGAQSTASQLDDTANSTVSEEVGTPAGDEGPIADLFRLALPAGLGEQGPLIKSGLSAVRLSSDGELPINPSEDTPERFSTDTFSRFGRSALSLILALDASPGAVQHGPKGYIGVAGNLLPGWTIALLALSLLVPVGLAAGFGLASSARSPAQAARGGLWAALRALPFLGALVVLLATALVGLLPSPDFPFDPRIESLGLGGTIAVVIAVLFYCTVAFFRGGVSIFIRSVVFFRRLHHSADECDWITRRGSALRWVQHEEHRGR